MKKLEEISKLAELPDFRVISVGVLKKKVETGLIKGLREIQLVVFGICLV